MAGCLQMIIYIIVEVIIGKLLDELIKRLTGRRIRLGWLAALLALFGIRLRKSYSNNNLRPK
jgi:hypothetical protein